MNNNEDDQNDKKSENSSSNIKPIHAAVRLAPCFTQGPNNLWPRFNSLLRNLFFLIRSSMRVTQGTLQLNQFTQFDSNESS